MRKVSYITEKQFDIFIPIIIFLICVFAGVEVIKDGGSVYPVYLVPGIWAVGVLPFISIHNYKTKRNMIRTNGKRFPGRIIGAYQMLSSRAISTFFLIISFNENGEKILITDGYVGDPNYKLADCNCNIYKWKGKYVEGDLITLGKDESPKKVNIPTEITHYPVYKESGKVRDYI